MGNSKLEPEFRVRWAELQFPPINLWVMASLSYDMPPQGETAHIHRRQRPGLDAVGRKTRDNRPHRRQPNALHKLHRRLESLLAVRGGKV